MHIILFEDHKTAENRPVNLPRAAFAVRLAATRLIDVATRCADTVDAITREYLSAVTRQAFELTTAKEGSVLLVNASLAPSFAAVEELVAEAEKGAAFIVPHGERVAAAAFPAVPAGLADQSASTITAFLLEQNAEKRKQELSLIEYPFHIMDYHQKLFDENLARLTEGLEESQPGVFMGEGCKIHPTALLETGDGPVVLGNNVSVGPFALLEGPILVGDNCKIIERATVKEQVQLGHTCKAGGEIECAIMEPYSNKQHHGFLGHAYVGSWVNMGAGTCNSDLKNTYGKVSIQHNGEKIDTGRQFLGCVIGDYSKTTINTSIFTGKIVGVASQVFGFVGTNVPSFTNYARTFGQETELLLDSAITTQQRMFERRKIEQTPADIKLLEDIHALTRNERLISAQALVF